MPRDTRFLPHPSRGGSRGYDIPFRQMVLDAYWAGTPPSPTPCCLCHDVSHAQSASYFATAALPPPLCHGFAHLRSSRGR